MANSRTIEVLKPTFNLEEDLQKVSTEFSGKYLELYYNLIFSEQGWLLPDHLRPLTLALCDNNIKKLMIIIAPGSGKALKNGTPIKTPNGKVSIEELKVGDIVSTPDGDAVNVSGVYPQGVKPLWRFTFSDNRTIDCSEDHLWKVYTGPTKWTVMPTKEIIKLQRFTEVYIPLTRVSRDEYTYLLNEIHNILKCHPHRSTWNGDIIVAFNTYEETKKCRELVQTLGGIAIVTKNYLKYNIQIIYSHSEALLYNNPKLHKFREIKLQIVKITKVKDAECTCITVNHPEHLYIAGDSIITHNSHLVDIAYPTYCLGHDNNLTILGISAAAALMEKFAKASMGLIEGSQIYHTLFPNTQPNKDAGWSSTSGMFVDRIGHEADPSYAAVGYGSSVVTGMHARIITLDDLQDKNNGTSSTLCDQVEEYYYDTILGRQNPMGARLNIIGRRFLTDDLYGRLLNSKDYLVMVLPAFRNGPELYFDVRIPANSPCIFNDFTANPEVEDIKVIYGESEPTGKWFGFYWSGMETSYDQADSARRNKPFIYETTYQSNPNASSNKIFNKSDFIDFPVGCEPPDDLMLGIGYDSISNYINRMNFDMIIQSWDTAWTANINNDASCGHTLALKGCQLNHKTLLEEPFHYDVYVLDEFYERMDYAELDEKIKSYFFRWMPSCIVMENAAAGIPLIKQLQSFSIQVHGITVQHTTKRSRAIESPERAGSVQGWARQGRIFVPHKFTWATDLLNECDGFTGNKGKPDDRVDSLIHGVNWIIDYGIVAKGIAKGWDTEEEINKKIKEYEIPITPLTQLPYLYKNVQAPGYGMCLSCKNWEVGKNWCKLHERVTVSIDSCSFYDPTIDPVVDVSWDDQPRILNLNDDKA